MKKFLRVCIGLLLCLMLTACGGLDDVSDDESDALGGLITRMQPITVFSATIPDSDLVMAGVELYLDENSTISSVTGQTSDVKEFGKSLGLEGLDLEEGLTKLFNAMQEKGYLDENKYMNIYVDSEDRKINLYNLIAKYEIENDIDLYDTYVYYLHEYNVINGDLVRVWKQDGSWYESTKTYQKGVLRKLVFGSESGYTRYREEHYDENGVITSYICEDEDGYHDYKFDTEGMPLYQVITSDDDQTKLERFFEGGVLVKEILTSPEYVSTTLYNENGTRSSFVCKMADGTYHDYKYDENGMPLYQVITLGDGYTKQEHFYENGVVVKQIISSPDYIGTTLYDASGNIIEFTEEYLEGE